ncbi:MAG: murein hydrolase activator EnvC family protein [Porticoccaceae bacterium]
MTGRFTRNYDSGRVFKGIDIQSAAGRPVTAAATGTVVYAGNGLPAYGQLIIIKHDDTYLSAYAHNRKLFVSEGVVVKSGQTISEVGGDPANPGRLYFEIRERGKPVDPLRLLPKQ